MPEITRVGVAEVIGRNALRSRSMARDVHGEPTRPMFGRNMPDRKAGVQLARTIAYPDDMKNIFTIATAIITS